jgi:hypothetical protein
MTQTVSGRCGGCRNRQPLSDVCLGFCKGDVCRRNLGLARHRLANIVTQLRQSGRDFDGDDLDEIGGTETPELAKLVTPHVTSSCHALEGLGVNLRSAAASSVSISGSIRGSLIAETRAGGFFAKSIVYLPWWEGPFVQNPSPLASSKVKDFVQ